MQLVPIEDRVLSLGAPLERQSVFYVASLDQNINIWWGEEGPQRWRSFQGAKFYESRWCRVRLTRSAGSLNLQHQWRRIFIEITQIGSFPARPRNTCWYSWVFLSAFFELYEKTKKRAFPAFFTGGFAGKQSWASRLSFHSTDQENGTFACVNLSEGFYFMLPVQEKIRLMSHLFQTRRIFIGQISASEEQINVILGHGG